MKPITYEQFLALVKRADRISCDGNTVDTYNEVDRGIVFYWEDADYLGFEVNVDDDKDFGWDANSGYVSFKDSDGNDVTFNFYIEFPLQEIPFLHTDLSCN